MKIVLIGNPNVGKSAVFSRLTGARVIISNYPGTTVEFTKGYMKLDERRIEVVDAPGTYTLKPTNKAEEVAVRMLKNADLVINIVDATNLERNLYLTMELLEQKAPLVVVLNMWDETKHRGIEIDFKKLENLLQVPVVPTCGLTGEGIKTLVEQLSQAHIPPFEKRASRQKWQDIGEIVKQVQKLHHRHHSLMDILQEVSIKPITGLPIAAAVVVISFQIVRFIAEGLINYIFDPFFDKIYLPLIMKLGAVLGSEGFLHHILIGQLIEGKVDFGQSFGLLTTGVYVPIAAVLPYIFSFYLTLSLLEDFGYLPRLAVLMDNFFHRLGLHGYAIVPTILSLGCNVPGALSTRVLESEREKFIAATLLAIAVPCMAQIAMIVGLVGARGGKYLGVVFFTLFLIWFVLGMILNRIIKGTSPEIILEIPPYRMPQILAIFKKVVTRMGGFLKEALPLVLLGILFVNVLYALRVIDFMAKLFAPLVESIWGLPRTVIAALLVGFLRKDVAVGMLAPLNLSTKQLVIGTTILAIYFPCFATFVVLVKELGIKNMLRSALIMLIVALVVGATLNLVLQF